MKHLLLVERSLYILYLKIINKLIFDRNTKKKSNSLFVYEPGATNISCFFVRIRKKTSSFVGSTSRIVKRALSDKDFINAAYC